MEKIINYIKEKYNPLTIIIYGSYCDGTNNLNSDFDALVISKDHQQCHDTNYINDIQLDVFVYHYSYFLNNYNLELFLQIFDGKIIVDTDDIGKKLKTAVLEYLKKKTKTKEEIQSNVDWCIKMLDRTKRLDSEGMFRWHWLLVDSLEIFCDILKHPYFGPKKTLNWMKTNHPDIFVIYKDALQYLEYDYLFRWVQCIKKLSKEQ